MQSFKSKLNKNLWNKSSSYFKAQHNLKDEKLENNQYLKKIKLLAKKSSNILDCGCGSGVILDFIWDKKAKFSGVDISSLGIKIAKKILAKKPANLFTSDLESLKFKDESFDLVYSTYLLEHLDNPEKVIDQMIRVTKKGGLLVFLAPNYGSPLNYSLATSSKSYAAKTKALQRLIKSHLYLLKHPVGLEWEKLKPLFLEENKWESDWDSTIAPNLQSLVYYLKNNNLDIIEFSSGIENSTKTDVQNLPIGLFLLKKIKLLAQILGKKGLSPYKYYGETLFLICRKGARDEKSQHKSLNKRVILGLVFIVLSGLFIRLWGINFGLPYFYHFDESATIYTAFYSANNYLRPDTFIRPMLYPYIMMFIYGIYFIFGLSLGYWNSTFQFFSSYLQNPTTFLLLGRLFTTFAAIFSILLVFLAGRRIYSIRIGLVSAFFLSFSFSHVQESHYLKEDVLIGFFSLLAFYFNYLVLKNSQRKYYLISGLIIGLLASLKYNFFIVVPMFILAHLLRKKQLSFKRFFELNLFLTFIASILTFFILNPYVLFDWQKAIPEIIFQAKVTTMQWVSSNGQPVWLYYLTYHLRYGLGLPLLLLALFGSFYLVFKSRKSEGYLLVLTPIIFFATLMVSGGTNFPRYVVMILPLVALIAAVFLVRLLNSAKNKIINSDTFLVLSCLIIILSPLLRDIKIDYLFTQPDTRTIAKGWIEANIPAGEKIVNEGAARSEYLSVFGPPLSMDRKTILTLLQHVQKTNQPGTYLSALLEAREGKIGYNLKGTITLDAELNPESLLHHQLLNVEKYVQDNYCYLISSSWAKGNGESFTEEFRKSLESNYIVIKKFNPNPILREDPSWRVDFSNLDKVNILSDRIIFGPSISVYKLRNSQDCKQN